MMVHLNPPAESIDAANKTGGLRAAIFTIRARNVDDGRSK
jgi:hypothetical protein